MNAIIPIHSKYVELIKEKKKRIEVRKWHYQKSIKGFFLYETAPVKKITTYVKVSTQEHLHSDYFFNSLNETGMHQQKYDKKFCEDVLKYSCLTKQELYRYVNDDYFTVFEVSGVHVYENPIEIRGPQSLKYCTTPFTPEPKPEAITFLPDLENKPLTDFVEKFYKCYPAFLDRVKYEIKTGVLRSEIYINSNQGNNGRRIILNNIQIISGVYLTDRLYEASEYCFLKDLELSLRGSYTTPGAVSKVVVVGPHIGGC